MRAMLVLNVVSHRLNTKETLPKFSRNLTLNHIGESLDSRGGMFRKPKMKTLFGVIATMLQTMQLWLSISVPKPWDLVFKTDPDTWEIFPRFRNGLDHDDRSSVAKVMPV